MSERVNRGNYYLIAYADGYDFIAESNENNNALARPIKITQPDLIVSSASVPNSGIPGNSIDINYTLKNLGDCPPGSGKADRDDSLAPILKTI